MTRAPTPTSTPPTFDRQRFLFITGKGGVGKTTITAALALSLARRGRRVLIAVPGPKERVSKLFACAPLTPGISRIAPGISGVLLVPEAALREYGTMVLKSQRLVDALFENKYVQGFFRGAPGLKEWAQLGKAWYHSIETGPDGLSRFDTVLFDAPATGHGLDMLRVPKIITELAPPGVLRSDADRAWRMFQDPAQSGVIVITLPEEMPTNETFELVTTLREELGLPIAGLLVNSLVRELFSERERQILRATAEPESSEPAALALGAGIRRAAAEHTQSESLARLETLALPTFTLPRIVENADRFEAIEQLAQALSGSRERVRAVP
jgi:anion-transporting  ArsA/GET3 family ATPase